MYDQRLSLSRQVATEAKRYFGEKVFDTVITRNVSVAEAPVFGQPVTTMNPRRSVQPICIARPGDSRQNRARPQSQELGVHEPRRPTWKRAWRPPRRLHARAGRGRLGTGCANQGSDPRSGCQPIPAAADVPHRRVERTRGLHPDQWTVAAGARAKVAVRPNVPAGSGRAETSRRQAVGLDRDTGSDPRVDDRTLLVLALVENIQREDLGPLEEAKAYGVLRISSVMDSGKWPGGRQEPVHRGQCPAPPQSSALRSAPARGGNVVHGAREGDPGVDDPVKAADLARQAVADRGRCVKRNAGSRSGRRRPVTSPKASGRGAGAGSGDWRPGGGARRSPGRASRHPVAGPGHRSHPHIVSRSARTGEGLRRHDGQGSGRDSWLKRVGRTICNVPCRNPDLKSRARVDVKDGVSIIVVSGDVEQPRTFTLSRRRAVAIKFAAAVLAVLIVVMAASWLSWPPARREQPCGSSRTIR